MTGRSVLVIGASSGIGLASALSFAGKGDRLVLMARDPGSLDRAAGQCRAAGAGSVAVVAGDTAEPADVESAVATATNSHDGLDVVVHTATVMAYGTIEQVPPEVFTRVVDTALRGTLSLVQAVMPVFRRQRHGVLIVVNSLLGSVTVPQMGAYATAKWAQRAMIRTLQQEVRSLRGVHVCLVSPGSINTPIYRQAANYTSHAARPPQPVLAPERVGGVVAGLADRPRSHVSIAVGPGNPVVVAGFRLLPRLYDALVGPLFATLGLTRTASPATAGNVDRPNPVGDGLHGLWPPDPATDPDPDPEAGDA